MQVNQTFMPDNIELLDADFSAPRQLKSVGIEDFLQRHARNPALP